MRVSRLTTLLVATAVLGTAQLAHAESIAVVNGVAIDKTVLDREVQNVIQNSNGQQQDTPGLRDNIKTVLVNQELVLQEAVRAGLEKEADVARAIDEARKGILRQALLNKLLKDNPVDEARIKARYDEIVAKDKGFVAVHPFQIVTKTEAEAQKVIADLKKGTAFTTLAKTRSIDPAAKQSGGDMGSGLLSGLPPMLADALVNLNKGQYSDKPVKSNIGFHVFKMEERGTPTLDQVKPQIAEALQNETVSKAVEALRAKAKIQ